MTNDDARNIALVARIYVRAACDVLVDVRSAWKRGEIDENDRNSQIVNACSDVIDALWRLNAALGMEK